MTDLEKRAINALQSVRFPAGGWYENRARFLKMKMDLGPSARLIETQQSDLWVLVWRFRRQIQDEQVVAHADALVNKAMRLIFDMEPSLAKG